MVAQGGIADMVVSDGMSGGMIVMLHRVGIASDKLAGESNVSGGTVTLGEVEDAPRVSECMGCRGMIIGGVVRVVGGVGLGFVSLGGVEEVRWHSAGHVAAARPKVCRCLSRESVTLCRVRSSWRRSSVCKACRKVLSSSRADLRRRSTEE